MAPGDWNLAHDVTAFKGNKENFRVESPAMDALKLEYRVCRLMGEGFESALRIGEGQAHDHACDKVEAAAEELPVEGLVDGLASAIKPARADGHIRALADGRKQALSLLNRGREVRVREENYASAGVEHAVADAISFTVVGSI